MPRILKNMQIFQPSNFYWVAASKPKALGMVVKSYPQATLEAATLS